MKKLLIILGVVCVALFSSCSKDDDNDDNNDNTTSSSGSMTVIINGSSFTVNSFNNTLLEEEEYGQKGRRMDIRTNVNNGLLILSVANWDWQNPPENGILEKTYDTHYDGDSTKCKDINGSSYCDGALGTYIKSSTTYMTLDDHEGHITITGCNTSNKTVSGTFEFQTVDFFETDTIIFSGSFSNLSYTVYQ